MMFANFTAIFSLTLVKTLQSHLVYLKIIVDNIIYIFAENIIYTYFICVFRLRKNSSVMFHIRQVKRNRGNCGERWPIEKSIADRESQESTTVKRIPRVVRFLFVYDPDTSASIWNDRGARARSKVFFER
ncbi:uncharacterized protein LOC122577288 isoform X1 [Bombus pyrosoma]|uniref:uncharacterized protein LOC122577288 isoform X1 n=1 Tax=Bombus pyrosoma TaxID=396416 RepID=UPI001CB8EADF|nr:uncharacterized protein LOC122577288 isoform X1 [Bombus pyrosoma]